MKKIFTLTLTAFILFLFTSVKGQNNDILKSFINRNDFALRSVQKHIIKSGDTSIGLVKSILKLQLISIKFYSSNVELSKRAAYQARKESLIFLERNAPQTLTDFKIKDKEVVVFGIQKPIDSADKYLSETEIKAVAEADANNPAAINSFITSLK